MRKAEEGHRARVQEGRCVLRRALDRALAPQMPCCNGRELPSAWVVQGRRSAAVRNPNS